MSIAERLPVPARVRALEERMAQKLHEYGSPELVANLAALETVIQSPSAMAPGSDVWDVVAPTPAEYDIVRRIANSPFAAYAAGLLLDNWGDHGEPSRGQTWEFLGLLADYVDRFQPSLAGAAAGMPAARARLAFSSDSLKIQNDANPQSYLGQKLDYHRGVLSHMNKPLLDRYGFSADFALRFAIYLTRNMVRYIGIKYEMAKRDPGRFPFCADARPILEIDPGNLPKWSVQDKNMLVCLLEHTSCSPGYQVEGFRDLLSDNIIFKKPIINTGDGRFLVAKPDMLLYKLDLILERLILDGCDDGVRDRFTKRRAKHLEEKTHRLVSGVFPKDCVFKNVYYYYKSKWMELDILVIYDNKVLIMESKSGDVASQAVRDGRRDMIGRIDKIMKKALVQCKTAREYILSSGEAVFYADKSEDRPLARVRASDAPEVLPVVTVLRPLGTIGTNLRNLESLGLFDEGGYPWLVYLYDLDVVTTVLEEPAYLVHYIQQRLAAQADDRYHAASEQMLLSYYVINGSFSNDSNGPWAFHTYLSPNLMDDIEAYYSLHGKKPKPRIPEEIASQVRDLQKGRRPGFTNITGQLLGLPPEYKAMITKILARTPGGASGEAHPCGF